MKHHITAGGYILGHFERGLLIPGQDLFQLIVVLSC
jgi:hypothetical protein